MKIGKVYGSIPLEKKEFIFNFGGLAQLARALDWQSKGHGFDSHNLHLKIKELQIICNSFLFACFLPELSLKQFFQHKATLIYHVDYDTFGEIIGYTKK